MCERYDTEVRIYLTARPNGVLEWQITRVEVDDQVTWDDGDIYRQKLGKPIIPSELGRTVSLSLRRAVRQALEAATAGAGDAAWRSGSGASGS